jgi:Mce-associated membrane protein
MSTTRHLVNRRRRLAAAATTQPRTVRSVSVRAGAGVGAASAPATVTVAVDPAPVPQAVEPSGTPGKSARAARLRGRPSRPTVLTAVLAVLTVLLGGFAALALARASSLHESADTGNTALTDTARTSEIKGAVATDVNAVFSYDYADAARTEVAAKRLLTGKAVQQYAGMIAQVRAQAPKQKLVLTTTVTSTGVQTISGDRARVLVYADQHNTSTAAGSGGTTYAAAMFAVDAVHMGGTWKIASIDTFG